MSEATCDAEHFESSLVRSRYKLGAPLGSPSQTDSTSGKGRIYSLERVDAP
ncbi:hypothetical protein Pmar_PMAR008299, partial [Perkinsus marinus ATCC 50983]